MRNRERRELYNFPYLVSNLNLLEKFSLFLFLDYSRSNPAIINTSWKLVKLVNFQRTIYLGVNINTYPNFLVKIQSLRHLQPTANRIIEEYLWENMVHGSTNLLNERIAHKSQLCAGWRKKISLPSVKNSYFNMQFLRLFIQFASTLVQIELYLDSSEELTSSYIFEFCVNILRFISKERIHRRNDGENKPRVCTEK